MNFQCQGCNRVCEWDSREPIEVTDDTEIKTIGGRFCNAAECIAAETRTYGRPIRDPAIHNRSPDQ